MFRCHQEFGGSGRMTPYILLPLTRSGLKNVTMNDFAQGEKQLPSGCLWRLTIMTSSNGYSASRYMYRTPDTTSVVYFSCQDTFEMDANMLETNVRQYRTPGDDTGVSLPLLGVLFIISLIILSNHWLIDPHIWNIADVPAIHSSIMSARPPIRLCASFSHFCININYHKSQLNAINNGMCFFSPSPTLSKALLCTFGFHVAGDISLGVIADSM